MPKTTVSKAPKRSRKISAEMARRVPNTTKVVQTKNGKTFYYLVLPSRYLKRIPAPDPDKATRKKGRHAMLKAYKGNPSGIRRDIGRKNSRTTADVKVYSKNPRRYDMKGVDTPGSFMPKVGRKK